MDDLTIFRTPQFGRRFFGGERQTTGYGSEKLLSLRRMRDPPPLLLSDYDMRVGFRPSDGVVVSFEVNAG